MHVRNLTIAVGYWLLTAPLLRAQAPVALELGKPVKAELVGGQTHRYMVAAKQGQFMRVNIKRPVFSTVVTVTGSDGLILPISVWPGAYMEPNTVCWIARAQKYSIEISPAEKASKT